MVVCNSFRGLISLGKRIIQIYNTRERTNNVIINAIITRKKKL